MEKFGGAVKDIEIFMKSQGLENEPSQVVNLKGNNALIEFVDKFKKVQRLKTRLDQYTDLEETQRQEIEALIPKEKLQGYKGMYLETVKHLKALQDKGGEDLTPEVDNLDFELVLLASDIIDYDYIMKLMAQYSQTAPSQRKMSKQQLIRLITSDAKFMDDKEDFIAYIDTLVEGQGFSEKQIRKGYQEFKAEKEGHELDHIAKEYKIDPTALKDFVDMMLKRMIFDDEALATLLEPLGLGWKARKRKKEALMDDLIPLLHKRTQGREISGLSAYE